jgi:hypothetical protein
LAASGVVGRALAYLASVGPVMGFPVDALFALVLAGDDFGYDVVVV